MKNRLFIQRPAFKHPDPVTVDAVLQLENLIHTQAQVNHSCDRAADRAQSWRRTTNLVLGFTAMSVPVLAVLATFASVTVAALMIGLSVFSVTAKRRAQFTHANLSVWSKELQTKIAYSKFNVKGNLARGVNGASGGEKDARSDDMGRGESGSGGAPVKNPKNPNGPPPLAAAAIVSQARAARG